MLTLKACSSGWTPAHDAYNGLANSSVSQPGVREHFCNYCPTRILTVDYGLLDWALRSSTYPGETLDQAKSSCKVHCTRTGLPVSWERITASASAPSPPKVVRPY